MTPILLRPLALCAALLLAGCATAPRDTGARWWNPLTWGSAREAHAADRAEARLTEARSARADAREDVLRAAQRAAHEATVALLTAPASRPVAVATESAGHAAANLDQALGALSAETLAAIRKQVEALVSDNSALRAEGERLRAAQRQSDYAAAAALAAAEKRAADAEAVATAARADLRQAYDRENALANELRTQKWISALTTAASILAALAAYAYRANAFGMADGVARGIAELRKKQPGAADIATQALDAGLNRAEQSRISRLVQQHLSTS